MITRRDLQAPPEKARPRRTTMAWAVFWAVFGVATAFSAVYQIVFVDDGAGWLLLTFLFIFAVLMLWRAVELWQTARRS